MQCGYPGGNVFGTPHLLSEENHETPWGTASNPRRAYPVIPALHLAGVNVIYTLQIKPLEGQTVQTPGSSVTQLDKQTSLSLGTHQWTLGICQRSNDNKYNKCSKRNVLFLQGINETRVT